MRMHPWLKRLLLFTLLLYVLYQAGPSIAAAFKVGGRHGLGIYDKERHSAQYDLTHKMIHDS